jgi:hypothetical protein
VIDGLVVIPPEAESIKALDTGLHRHNGVAYGHLFLWSATQYYNEKSIVSFRVKRGIWLLYHVAQRFLAPLEMTIRTETSL